jgi:DNA-binding transcriptional regulator YiaG
MPTELKTIEMPVVIPNLEGDGIAETRLVRVPITMDSETGEESLTEEAIRIIDDTKARFMGLLLPDEIREMRKRFNLTQKRMSELLQAGEKSYTRWESGRARPSRMVNVLLRLLYEGKVFVGDLVSQREQGINWREKVLCQPQRKRNPYTIRLDRFQTTDWNKVPNCEDHENLPLAA